MWKYSKEFPKTGNIWVAPCLCPTDVREKLISSMVVECESDQSQPVYLCVSTYSWEEGRAGREVEMKEDTGTQSNPTLGEEIIIIKWGMQRAILQKDHLGAFD